jgi:hypothetical protein
VWDLPPLPKSDSLTGKLRNFCLALFHSLTTLEKTVLDASCPVPGQTAPPFSTGQLTKIDSVGRGSDTQNHLGSLSQPVELDRRPSREGTLSLSHIPNALFKPILPPKGCSDFLEACTDEEGDDNLTLGILSGFLEEELDDGTLVATLENLVSLPQEMGISVPLATFQGLSVIQPPIQTDLTYTSETGSGVAGTSYAWSRGLGFETSPIKTRSARKKASLCIDKKDQTISIVTDLGALRGLKSLARAKI